MFEQHLMNTVDNPTVRKYLETDKIKGDKWFRSIKMPTQTKRRKLIDLKRQIISNTRRSRSKKSKSDGINKINSQLSWSQQKHNISLARCNVDFKAKLDSKGHEPNLKRKNMKSFDIFSNQHSDLPRIKPVVPCYFQSMHDRHEVYSGQVHHLASVLPKLKMFESLDSK